MTQHRSPRVRQTSTHLGEPESIQVTNCSLSNDEDSITIEATVSYNGSEAKNYMLVTTVGGVEVGSRDMIIGFESNKDKPFIFENNLSFSEDGEVVLELRSPDGSEVITTHKCGEIGGESQQDKKSGVFPFLALGLVGAGAYAVTRGDKQ